MEEKNGGIFMLYRTIPGLARKASAIILGSGGLGTGEQLEYTFATLDAYLAIGGNWIDAARIYGNPPGDVEKAIGEWLRARLPRSNHPRHQGRASAASGYARGPAGSRQHPE